MRNFKSRTSDTCGSVLKASCLKQHNKLELEAGQLAEFHYRFTPTAEEAGRLNAFDEMLNSASIDALLDSDGTEMAELHLIRMRTFP